MLLASPFYLEISALLSVPLIAFFLPQVFMKFSRWTEKTANRIAARPVFSSVLILSLLIVGAASIAFLLRFPEPTIHDEFSYLLAGDTFARGRLSNPTHPLWVFFEALHVLHVPAYVSKYPPGQGLFLALGIRLAGHPIAGVWLSSLLACGTLYWMLRAWTRPRWAFLGTFLFVLQVGIASYWTQSYWGGMAALWGGALYFGGLRRLIRFRKARYAALMAAGLVVLANTRPYEGFLTVLPAGVVLCAGAWRHLLSGRGREILRLGLPLFLVLAAGAGWMGYYNNRITGNPLKMPYSLHRETYGGIAYFFWQKPVDDIRYRHESLRMYYTRWKLWRKENQGLISWWLEYSGIRGARAVRFWGIYLMVFPFLYAVSFFRRRWLAVAFVTVLMLWLNFLFAEVPYFCHYSAPVAPLMALLAVESLRRVHILRRRQGTGRIMVLLLTVVYVLVFLADVGRAAKRGENSWAHYRVRLVSELTQDPWKHLIFIRYPAKRSMRDIHQREWIANGADLENSEVLFAHDMGPERNQELIDYYPGRKVWMIFSEPGRPAVRRPYEDAIREISGKAAMPSGSPQSSKKFNRSTVRNRIN